MTTIDEFLFQDNKMSSLCLRWYKSWNVLFFLRYIFLSDMLVISGKYSSKRYKSFKEIPDLPGGQTGDSIQDRFVPVTGQFFATDGKLTVE